MTMPRLTDEALPLDTFHRCQLCGVEHPEDICKFRMWVECDEDDQPEDITLITCKPCVESKINPHPRLYIEVPWGRGGPGKFMLVCGDCPWRKSNQCSHPDLKANGGEGLEVRFSPLGFKARVCFTDGTSMLWPPQPAVGCAGKDGNDTE